MSYLILQLLGCVLLADFLTGLIHWWEDCYGLPQWPVLGKLVIEPNIDHHINPGLMGAMSGLIDRNYQSVLLAGLVVLISYLIGSYSWQLFLVAIIASLGNEVHLWSHRRSNSSIIKFLQDCAVIQIPAQHAKHHKPPYDKYYCTITNVVNPILERIYFWRVLEWSISLVGIKPKRMTKDRKYV